MKRNWEHYGTGTIVFPNLAAGLAAAADAAVDCVVQPHITKPLLLPGGHKFHVRVYALAVRRAGQPNLEGWLHAGGTMSISPKLWDASSIDRTVQVTNTVTPGLQYTEWSGYQLAHRAITANVTRLLAALAEEVSTEPPPKRRDHFSLAGLDFMLAANFRPWLLEANYSSRLYDDSIIRGMVDIVFCQGSAAQFGWHRLV